jgi:hypothetical protein
MFSSSERRYPLVPAKAGTQPALQNAVYLDSRRRGNERKLGR